MPLISVVMPMRAWHARAERAVRSVLAQSHDNLELLLVGQDDVAQWIERLPNDERVRGLVRTAPGIVGALNTGLAQARGSWIARMDSDDHAYPDRLKTQLDFLQQHSSIGLCASQVRLVGQVGDGNRRYERWLNAQNSPDSIHQSMFVECTMPHPTWLAAKEVWQRVGPYRQSDWPEDYDFVLRAWRLGVRMGKPAEVLLDWQEHDDRLTWTDSRYSRAAFVRAKAAHLAHPDAPFSLHHGTRGVWICGVGRNARHWCDALAANHVVVRGFVDLERPDRRRQKRHLPVIDYNDLWRCRGRDLIVTAVTQHGARETLQQAFQAQGLEPMIDYVLGG